MTRARHAPMASPSTDPASRHRRPPLKHTARWKTHAVTHLVCTCASTLAMLTVLSIAVLNPWRE